MCWVVAWKRIGNWRSNAARWVIIIRRRGIRVVVRVIRVGIIRIIVGGRGIIRIVRVIRIVVALIGVVIVINK